MVSISLICCIVSNFYIKSQPLEVGYTQSERCIVSNFYIKSQPLLTEERRDTGCIVSNFYIKSQQNRESGTS